MAISPLFCLKKIVSLGKMAKSSNASGLTDKQEKFCLEYVVDFNATKAAIRAGYSEDTAGSIGGENLKKPEIQEYIRLLQQTQAKELEISAAYITENLKNIAERCMQAQAVLDKKGLPTGEYKFDAMAALKAHELLGKRIGYFEIDNGQKKPDLTVNLSDYSFDQLIELRNKRDAG